MSGFEDELVGHYLMDKLSRGVRPTCLHVKGLRLRNSIAGNTHRKVRTQRS